MNIAIFTNNYLPNPFGVSMSIESFRGEFEKLGHTVYIFAPAFKGYVDKGNHVFRYPAIEMQFRGIRFPLVIPYSRAMDKVLEKIDIDIIHSQHPNLLGWQARRWARKKHIPLVFTWHTLYDQYAHFNPFLPSKISAWWAVRNAAEYANRADCVIVPTGSAKKIIATWGMRNKNTTVIPTGINEEDFDAVDTEAMRKKMKLPKGRKILLLASRLTAEKNVFFLAQVIAEILSKCKGVVFVVAGEGAEQEKMRAFFKQEGVLSQVIFAGMMGRKDIAGMFSLADVFVYASKSETQGLIIAEAMYAGLPVVALDATGVKDFVMNHVTGLLVREDKKEFCGAIGGLLDNQIMRNEFSKKAKKIARENFTAATCAEKMIRVYKHLIKQ